MSSSGADASDPDAALARLSGPELVAHLRVTCRRADYDAAARVLGDRDRRLARAEAGLAECLRDLAPKVQALEERYVALKAAEQSRSRSSGGAIAAAAPRVGRRAEEPPVPIAAIVLCSSSSDDDDGGGNGELEEGEFRPGVAGVSCERKESASEGDEGHRAGDSCERKQSTSEGDEGCTGFSIKRKESASEGDEARRAGFSCKRKEPASACSPDGEDDKIPLSQFMKKRRSARPRANGGPKKGHGAVQANSSGPLGVDRPVVCGPVSERIPEGVAGHLIGSSDDPKVTVFVQGTGNGQSGKNGRLSRTMPSPTPTGSTAENSPLNNSVDRPVISAPVNRGIPEAVAEHMFGSSDDPKVVVFVQGTGNGQSGKNGGLSRTMPGPPATCSIAGNNPLKKCSKPDGSEGRVRIGEKRVTVAGPENDTPVQVRTSNVTDTARRIVGSARVGAATPMEHTSPDGTISMVLTSFEGQEKAMVSLETNGTGDKTSMVLRDSTREQAKPDGQLLNTKVLSGTDGIREQGGKLSPCQNRVDTHGGRPTTSDKPVSATLQQENQLVLHSEQMSVESSLPSEVTRHWESSSDVLVSCLNSKELCMQAACALHRQNKFTTRPTGVGITKFDAHRVAVLVEFLLDGNLQGPLKRTAEDLEKHDSTGHDFLERVVLQFSKQLFSIYRNKDDKYFR